MTQLLSSINGGDCNDPAAHNALSSRILLDNCANVSSASSELAPNSLRLSDKPTRVSCNAGSVDLDHDITYGGFVFKANDNSQENILSQGDLEDAGYRVQYDSDWGYYKVSNIYTTITPTLDVFRGELSFPQDQQVEQWPEP